MSDLYAGPDDATPLTPEEREGLIPANVTLRGELNEIEQLNILDADLWAFRRVRDPIGEPFGRRLHRRMFGRVWRWAGAYRTTDKNLGVSARLILQRLYAAYDAGFWREQQTFPPDELAVRFHHALVFIHPFANGNGRWSRLMADILLAHLGMPRFSFGRSGLRSDDQMRRAHVDALHAADRQDFAPLIRSRGHSDQARVVSRHAVGRSSSARTSWLLSAWPAQEAS